MTQDQYGQARGPGDVIHGDPVPDEETEEQRSEDTKPMTRFQKVASALRGDRAADRDDEAEDLDQPAADRMSTSSEEATGSDVMSPGGETPVMSSADAPYATERNEAAMTDSPIYQETGAGRTSAAEDMGPAASRVGEPSAADAEVAGATRRDYWDEPAGAGRTAATRGDGIAEMDPDVPVDETNPDVPASATRPDADTERDSFGTAGGTHGAGTGLDEATVPVGTAVPAAEGQPGAATIADVPAGASFETATGAQETGAQDAAFPAAAATPAQTAGGTGRHAAATPTDRDRELRPGEGEATGSLGDFSDLTFGDLIPDAAHYTDQWQQVQFRFVDDPHASVTEAAEIVAQVTAKLEAAIQERQRAIEERQRAIQEQQRSLRDRWGEGSNADTENLRATLRMYKTFLDQLIGGRGAVS